MPKYITSLSDVISLMDFLSEVSTLYRVEPGPEFRLEASNSKAQLLGVGSKSLRGKLLHNFIPRDYYRNKLLPFFEMVVHTHKPCRFEQTPPFPGSVGVMDILLTPVIENEKCTHVWVITKYRESKEKLEYLSTHDVLTDIPNRRLFYQRLHQAHSRHEQHQIKFAMMYLDCDHFKHINDTLGHDVGDRLLSQVAQRLKMCVREADLVARFGGDEFAILLEDVQSDETIDKVADRITNQFREPFHILGHSVKTTLSIGAFIVTENQHDIQTVISFADKALYRAKSNGRNNYVLYQGNRLIVQDK